MAQFNPMSEDEAKKSGLMKIGAGEFEVIEAEDKTGKAPNYTQYLYLKLRVWDGDGKEGTIIDRVMYEGGFAFKMRHFCFCINQGQAYESGDIQPAEFIGSRGACEIGHKDDDFAGRMVNVIKKYIVPEAVKDMTRYQNSKAANAPAPRAPSSAPPANAELAPAGTFKDEEIPF